MSEPIQRLDTALGGRYSIERELGEGGMATVYLADDSKHDRQVAIKVLRPELAAVVGAERFLAEIKTTANLQHPFILPLHDSGEAEGFLYYVMPYVQGESLREKLDREKQLRVAEAIDLTRKVADALDYAHGKGVVHRDIKPANILLSERGEPLVADFGIALAVSQAGGGRITETGLSLGTPHYMSPEQATGDRDVDPRSDVYALGCVLYEMLSGQPPFAAPTAQAVLAKILTERPRRVSETRDTVPPHIGAVLARALEKLPADRFESAAEFVQALDDESFAYVPPVAAATVPVPTAPPSTERAALRGAGPVPRWAAAALLLLAGTTAWGWLRPASDTAAPPTRTFLDLGDIGFVGSERIEVSRDGAYFAFAGAGESGRMLYLRKADDEGFRALPGTEDASNPTFSPAGDWIAFEANDGLWRVSVAGGAPRPVVPPGGDAPRYPEWAHDGTILFRMGGGLFRVAEAGGEPEPIISENTPLFNFRLLPSGRGLVATDRDVGSTVFLDLATDSVRLLLPNAIDARYLDSGHLLYSDQAGSLWAVAFDEKSGELTGETTPLFGGVTVVDPNYMARLTVSANGTLVYGAGGIGRGSGFGVPTELVHVGLDGSETVDPLTPRVIIDVRWAPDGDRVAYAELRQGASGDQTTGAHISVYNTLLRTTPNPITYEGDNVDPVWSPDGTRLAFASEREGTDEEDLWVKEVETDAPPEPLLTLPGDQYPLDWPEDDVLVFSSDVSGSEDLWVVNPTRPDSVASREYLPSENILLDAVVSPDRRFAAYASLDATFEVFVRAFPEARQPSRVSEGFGRYPSWSPDGGTLYYWVTQGGLASLVAARIQSEPSFQVLARETLFEGAYRIRQGGGLHPDGDRFLVTRAVSGAAAASEPGAAPVSERFVVVTNWFQELRALMGEGR